MPWRPSYVGVWVLALLPWATASRSALQGRRTVCRSAPVASSDSEDHVRVGIKVAAPRPILNKLAASCRMEAGIKRGLTGIVYGLPDGGVEILVEGRAKYVSLFQQWAEGFVNGQCSTLDTACDVATVRAKQLDPTAGAYQATFPFVNLAETEDKSVRLVLHGDHQVLDYTLRHCQIEASFNRGLACSSRWLDDRQLELVVSGPVAKLKSFVRWCKRGPPLQRPERVVIQWEEEEDALGEGDTIAAAMRDEGIGM